MIKSLLKFSLKAIVSIVLCFGIFFSNSIRDNYYRTEVGTNVVRIFNMEKTGSGTGFHVFDKLSNTIVILTNKHVCEIKDENGMVLVEYRGEEIPRKVIDIYEHHDLCVVEAIPEHSDYIDIAGRVDIGDDILIVGHPGGRDLTLSHGEYIGKKTIHLATQVESETDCKGRVEFDPFSGGIFCIQQHRSDAISAVAYGGNSGSPVIDKYGEVVGVLFAGSRQPTDSYMVPLKYIKDFLGYN